MASYDITLSDLKKRALGLLGSSVVDNHYGSLVVDFLNDAQQRMIMRAEGLERALTIFAVVSQRGYNLPADLITIRSVHFNGLPLQYRRVIDQDFFSSGTTTYPDRYALFDGQILLGPLPPATAYAMVIRYMRAPALLENDSDKPEVPPRFRPALADYAAAQQLIADGNLTDAQVLMQRFDRDCEEYRQEALMLSRDFRQIRDEAGYY